MFKKTGIWIYFISDVKGEEIVGTFNKKELRKTNLEFRIEKVIKRKGIKVYDKWKGKNSYFNSWIDKKDRVQMIQYFPEPKSLGKRVKVELVATGVGTSKFTKKADLANSKSNVDKWDNDKLKNILTNLSNLKKKIDKLDIDKLLPVPVDLSKLRDVVKNNFVEKDVYNAKIKNTEDKIPDVTNLPTKSTLNTKINEVKGKIPVLLTLLQMLLVMLKQMGLQVKYLIVVT